MSKDSVVTSKIYGKDAPKIGVAPSILLTNPKYPDNLGKVLRLASCYGISQVWYTGNRISLDQDAGDRLPREERMRGYKEVTLTQNDYPFDCFEKDVVPVAIEVRENAEPLYTFEHPENALYVFGPEDGSISQVHMRHCHRFVVIPTRHCLNLATAVSTILWDRQYKKWLNGEIEDMVTPGIFEDRGFGMETG